VALRFLTHAFANIPGISQFFSGTLSSSVNAHPVVNNGINSRSPTQLSRRGFLQFCKNAASGASCAALFSPLIGCDHELTPSERYNNSRLAGELHKVRPLTEAITHDVSTTEERAAAVAEWVAKNFFHALDKFSWDVYEKYGFYFGHDDYFQFPIEIFFSERVVGCHLASAIIVTMLRSIDIDAEYINVAGSELFANHGHGITYVPEIEGYIHGDVVAQMILPGNDMILGRDDAQMWYGPNYEHLFDALKEENKYWARLYRVDRPAGEGDPTKVSFLYFNGWMLPGWTDENWKSFQDLCYEFQPILDGDDVYGSEIPLLHLHELVEAL